MTDLNTLYSQIFSKEKVIINTLSVGDFFLGASKHNIYKIVEINDKYIIVDIVYKDNPLYKWNNLNAGVYPEIK